MELFRSIATVGLYTLGSRILGFIRTVMMASFLGTSAAADALSIAIRLPSMLRRLFAEGAFSAAFVPIYAGLLSIKNRKQEAHNFASGILSILLLSLIIITFLAEYFMPSILKMMVFGFSKERLTLTIQLTRMTFPFIIFISLCAFYGGILNSLNNFSAFASSPMVGNISIIILSLIGLQYLTVECSFAFALFACGLVQFLWVYFPARSQGIKFKLHFPKLSAEIKQFAQRFIPAAAGSGVVQINIFIGAMIASMLPVGGVSIISYADRLVQLPLSVIGTAVGTALLPLLSKQILQKNIQGAIINQQHAIEFSVFLIFPAMAGLISLADPLVSILFEHGKFGPAQTLETEEVLSIFVLGLPAYILIKIFSSSLFAQQDAKTPLMAAILSLLFDIIICLILLPILKSIAIAFATFLSSWINVIILGSILSYRGFLVFNKSLVLFLLHAFILSIFTFVILRKSQDLFAVCFINSTFSHVTSLSITILGGFIVFFIISHISGFVELKELKKKFK